MSRGLSMTPARSLAEVLSSVSDVLFPAELGEHPVEVNSRGAGGDTPLHVLAWPSETSGAELLIAAGADVNAIGDMGETPLHVAVRMQNRDLVAALLRAGADPFIRS